MARRGDALRTIREQLGLSKGQLAAVLGRNASDLDLMEAGAAPVDSRTEFAVQNLCTLSYEELAHLLVTPPLNGSELAAPR